MLEVLELVQPTRSPPPGVYEITLSFTVQASGKVLFDEVTSIHCDAQGRTYVQRFGIKKPTGESAGGTRTFWVKRD